MDLEPPSGSRISVTTDGAVPVIVIPHGNRGPIWYIRYLVGSAMVCWLALWSSAFLVMFAQLWSGRAPALLVVVLAGWTLAGAFAMNIVYRTFRPSVPESLRLMANGVAYDSGVAFGYASRSRNDDWRSLFPKRTHLEIDWRHLRSLYLRATDGGNRLTVDVGVRRLDIAGSAGEIEREWLYQLMAKRYSLAPAKDSAERRSG